MALGADLALYDVEGRLVAVAEVKNRTGTSGRWAAKTRRNLLAHGFGAGSGFFLLVTPDRLYAWKDAGDDPVEVPPMYEEDITTTVAAYLNEAGLSPDRVSGPAFELVVAAWLGDVMHLSEGVRDAGMDWLDESGFRAAVRDGRVELEAEL